MYIYEHICKIHTSRLHNCDIHVIDTNYDGEVPAYDYALPCSFSSVFLPLHSASSPSPSSYSLTVPPTPFSFLHSPSSSFPLTQIPFPFLLPFPPFPLSLLSGIFLPSSSHSFYLRPPLSSSPPFSAL
jgi:hypothetical protein